MPTIYRIIRPGKSTIEFQPITTIGASKDVTITFTTNKQIGKGNWGEVYTLTTTTHIEDKVVKIGFAQNSERNRRLIENEFQKFKAIYGKSSVYLQISALTDGRFRYCLLMKKLPGIDLLTYMQKNTLSAFEKLHILLAIFKKLKALHTKGYIHGDLKPQNIHIEKNTITGEYEIYFLDFCFTCSITGTIDIAHEDCPYWTRDRVLAKSPPSAHPYQDIFSFLQSAKICKLRFDFDFINTVLPKIYDIKSDPLYIPYLQARQAKIEAKAALGLIQIEYYQLLQNGSQDPALKSQIETKLQVANKAVEEAQQAKKIKLQELSEMIAEKNREQAEEESKLAHIVTLDALIETINNALLINPEFIIIKEYCLKNCGFFISVIDPVQIKEILLTRLPDKTTFINSIPFRLCNYLTEECCKEIENRLYTFFVTNEHIFLQNLRTAEMLIQLRSAENYALVADIFSNFHVQKFKQLARDRRSFKINLINFNVALLKKDIKFTFSLANFTQEKLNEFINKYFSGYPKSITTCLTQTVITDIINHRIEKHPGLQPLLAQYQAHSKQELITLLLKLKSVLTVIDIDPTNLLLMESFNALTTLIPDSFADKSPKESGSILRESFYQLYLLCSQLPTYERALLKAAMQISSIPTLEIDPKYQFILATDNPYQLCQELETILDETHKMITSTRPSFFKPVNTSRQQTVSILHLLLESTFFHKATFASLLAQTLSTYERKLSNSGKLDPPFHLAIAYFNAIATAPIPDNPAEMLVPISMATAAL